MPTFLYHIKINHPRFLIQRMVDGGRPLLPEILGQAEPPPMQRRPFS